MDDGRGTAAEGSDPGLPNVSVLPLPQLITSRDTVLDSVLRWLVQEIEHAPPSYAAFGNTP